MGGFFRALGDLWTKGMTETKAGRALDDYGATKAYDMDLIPEGRNIKSKIEQTRMVEAKVRDNLNKPYNDFWTGVKKQPQAVEKSLKLGTNKIIDIHNELTRQGNPLRQYTSQIMQQNVQTRAGISVPMNAGLTMKDVSLQNEKQATFLALRQVMGSHYQAIMPDLMKLLESPDATERMLGERYADTLADEFRDREKIVGRSKKGTIEDEQSRIKIELNKVIDASNKARKAAGAPIVKRLSTKPTYTTPGKVEQAWTGFLRTTQAVFAFVPHISMEVNLALKSPFKALFEGTVGMTNPQIKAARDAAHIMSVQSMDIVRQELAASTGMIAKVTGPKVARFIDKVYHIPFFHPVRNFEIKHAGSVGYKTAEYWSGKLMQNKRVKIAEDELRQMHIDPADIRLQRGVLTPEQYQSAMYHYSQQTMFAGRSGMHMPLRANSTLATRSYSMYHYFVRGQYVFLKNTLWSMVKAKDYPGIARYIGVLCVAWPNLAPLLMGLSTLLRTGSPSTAGRQIEDKYRKLYSPTGAGEWALNYIGLLAHMGAVSDYMNYWDSIANYGLLKTVIGPKIATPWVYIQDAMQAGRGMSPKPLARDVLQMVPLVGKPASHILVPTKKEEGTPVRGPFSRHGRRGFGHGSFRRR